MTADLDEIKKILTDHEQRILKLESPRETKTIPINKSLSINEFILQYKLTSDVDKTLAIAYYYETYQGKNYYTANEIKDGFMKAKEKVPTNVNDKILKCVKKGFIQESDQSKKENKYWTLTNSGIKYVKNGFKNA
ncbi:hypothetical protein JXB02_00220 [Candidatus Woesearchaeota archaeon]|nr:hypothetical protein [Candidatus Woesearchaeota archaeon]